MKIAAIDVGTNSCRLLVVDYIQGELQEIKRGLITSRLGEGVDKNKLLKKDSIERTLAAITDFIKETEKLGVKELRIIGTSALRDVKNSEKLVDVLYKRTGKKISIVSGLEEANLIATGISLNLKNYLIIDIGGGSTEFIWSKNKDLQLISLDIGAVRMTERYVSNPSLPLKESQVLTIKEVIKEKLAKELKQKIRGTEAIGVGGTITTLAAMALGLKEYNRQKIEQCQLETDTIIKLLEKLRKKDLKARKKIPGLQPERADIIIAGTIILQSIIEYLNLGQLLVSEQGILEGIIRQIVNKKI